MASISFSSLWTQCNETSEASEFLISDNKMVENGTGTKNEMMDEKKNKAICSVT